MSKYKWPVKLLHHRFGELERLWLVRDESELSGVRDGDAVLFVDDVPKLKGMDDEQLKQVYEASKLFKGVRVQE